MYRYGSYVPPPLCKGQTMQYGNTFCRTCAQIDTYIIISWGSKHKCITIT